MTQSLHADAVAAARTLAQLNTAYTQAKVLHSAVELGLFEALASGPATADALCQRLGLHPRLAPDFLGALVGLDLLEYRDGQYHNARPAQVLLVPGGPLSLNGSIRQHGKVHYGLWADLTDALRDGRAKSGPQTPAGAVTTEQTDLDAARRFMAHMDSFNSIVAPELAQKVDWSKYRTFVDVGGARGNLSGLLVKAHPHLSGTVFDVPGLRPLFDEHMETLGTTGKVGFQGGDFFSDPLPEADVVIFGHVLHDWPEEARKKLIERAFPAVRPGGALLVYDAMIEDGGFDAHAHLQSLICSLMRDGGSEYTEGAAREWAEKAGFRAQDVLRLNTVTNDRLLIAVKDA
ncbi:O-methyltransferase [Kitasatospora phosalacinea]|uniref:O-methyltransferase n=1 Tax=Kitasatospora phosalacinea TaxID=2065 RepID=A0A9W6QC88_9ACTN|nr:methyltransferase [Kitasatospora phosalacinea]GLW74460.1 O-methyltransferase [Kitasatospora phosalacinea]